MNSSSNAPNDLENHLLLQTEEWSLVKEQGVQVHHRTVRLFLVWCSSGAIPIDLLQACSALNADSPRLPGLQIQFHEIPSPGFVIDIDPQRNPTTPLEAQQIVELVLWEINRMIRR